MTPFRTFQGCIKLLSPPPGKGGGEIIAGEENQMGKGKGKGKSGKGRGRREKERVKGGKY